MLRCGHNTILNIKHAMIFIMSPLEHPCYRESSSCFIFCRICSDMFFASGSAVAVALAEALLFMSSPVGENKLRSLCWLEFNSAANLELFSRTVEDSDSREPPETTLCPSPTTPLLRLFVSTRTIDTGAALLLTYAVCLG